MTTFCAVISGAEGWIDVETYGKLKLSLLKNYLPFNHGTPSDDTFRRFFRALDPITFHNCFIQWVHSFAQSSQIAIDGKTLRGSKDAEQNALHLISAFATEANLVLAQKKVDGKSNEITAIPELLNWLDLRGAIVTIDAMGCQKEIARRIKAKEGDFVLGLKGNHPALFQEVKDYFKESALQGCSEWNKGHGRLEQRVCYASNEVEWLLDEWPEVKSLVMVESKREIQGKTSQEKRYYLSSLAANPEQLLSLIRSHWAIENSL